MYFQSKYRREAPGEQGDVSSQESSWTTTHRTEDIAIEALSPGGRQFRLVKLLPPNDSDRGRIEIELETFDIDAVVPPYAALSYTWFNAEQHPSRYQKIYSSGRECAVTPNLWHALGYLRLDAEPRYLWIDQICIRQRDNDEKSHQLPLMWKIYSQAPGGVIAWLGADEKHVSDLMQYMSYIVGERLWDDDKFNLGRLLDFDDESDRSEGLRALIGFLSISWWSRIWVVQEAAAQKDRLTLRIGEFSFTFSTLTRVVEETNRRMLATYSSLSANDRHTDGRVTYFTFLRACPAIHSVGTAGSRTLQDLVQTFCSWESTLPHDKIYALQHLASDVASYPAPDYNLNFLQVYREVAKRWLKTGLPNVLAALSFAASRPPPSVYPSWTTNWAYLGPKSPINPYRNNYKFSAGGNIDERASYTFDGELLRLKGVEVDHITATGPVLEGRILRQGGWLQKVRNLMDDYHVLKGQDGLDTDEDLAKLFVLDGQSSLYGLTGQEGRWGKALLENELVEPDRTGRFTSTYSSHGGTYWRYREAAPDYSHLGVSPHAARPENPVKRPRPHPDEPAEKDGGEVDKKQRPSPDEVASKQYRNAFWAINIYKRLFYTKNGRIGVANADIRKGMDIVVLQGARMPMVTVAADDGRGERLVSEAYVRGIMHGESLEGRGEFNTVVIV